MFLSPAKLPFPVSHTLRFTFALPSLSVRLRSPFTPFPAHTLLFFTPMVKRSYIDSE